MDEEGTANACADDEGMASKEEAVDEGEQFMEGESIQGQYYPLLSRERALCCLNLCRNYGMCLTISNVLLFLFIYLKVSILHPRQIPTRTRPRSKWPATRRQISWKWKKIHWSGGRSTSMSIHSCHNLLKGTSVPGTSVSSERVFSTAGDIITAQRSALLLEHIDQILFLNKNLERM